MKAVYDNRLEDLLTLNQYLSSRERRRRRNKRIAVFAIGAVLLGGAVGWGAAPWTTTWPLVLFLGAMAAVAFTVGPFLERRSLRQAVERAWEEDRHLGEQALEIGPGGLRHTSSRGEQERPWAEVTEVVITGDALLFLCGDEAGYVVPRVALADEGEFTEYAGEAVRLHSAESG